MIVALVSGALEVLALELGELDAVCGVADVEVEDGPDEREAAGLTGEAADDLGAAFDLAERSFEQALPVDERHAVAALLRQLDFHGHELGIIGAELGLGAGQRDARSGG